MPTVRARGELQLPVEGFAAEWAPYRVVLLGMPGKQRDRFWRRMNRAVPQIRRRRGLSFRDALLAAAQVAFREYARTGTVAKRPPAPKLGAGANMKPRPCLECEKPIVPTGRRGQPRRRHPECGGRR